MPVQCMETTDDPRKCFAYREDYLECLHHRKEVRALAPPVQPDLHMHPVENNGQQWHQASMQLLSALRTPKRRCASRCCYAQ